MNSAQWARVTALFDEARERPTLDRDTWLRDVCEDDDTRAEVIAMLRAYDDDPAFMEQPPDLSAAVAQAVSGGVDGSNGGHGPKGSVGRRLGAYRIVAEIGRGGMGVVYEVQRDDREFDRRAAIKILQASGSASLFERFRFERRVLAGLDHPGIARLIDSGTTPDGLPYFVMEYVDGQRIDDWCRARGLKLRERVALVERVCEALAYAHQNLVIHRDVKPANILVTEDGQPKLLDFGIATMLMGEGEESIGTTRTGHHSFTPEYASPEQIRGDRVTTASDVYSVGVVLYQLLAERAPYAIRALSPLEAMRTVCDVDPPLMSAVATHAERASLRGDLDSIVAKALAKAPGERYGTIAALTADLQAWREGRPVSASPQSMAYRARRFVRRNRGAVAAVAAIVAAVIAGGAATAWQAHVAARERDKAQNRFRQVQEFSRSLLFDVHDALRPFPGATEARRLLLSRAVQLLDGLTADAGDDHALKLELAEGYRRLGAVQGAAHTENLGDNAAAVVSSEKAARLIEDVMRADWGDERRALEGPLLALNIYSQLANAFQDGGKPDAAMRAHERHVALLGELELRRAAESHLFDAPARIEIGNGYSNAGNFHAAKRELTEARAFYEVALRLYGSVANDDPAWQTTPRGYSLALKRLGAVEMVSGAMDASERHYREALAIEEDLLRKQPDNAQWQFEMSYTLSDLGTARVRQGDVDGAMVAWRRALALRRTAIEADPKNVRAINALAAILNRIGRVQRDRKEYPEAEAALREELRLRDTSISIQGASRVRLLDYCFAKMNLVALLLNLADDADAANRGTPATRAHVAEARLLFQSVKLDDLKAPGTGEIDADFRKWYDTQATRLARR